MGVDCQMIEPKNEQTNKQMDGDNSIVPFFFWEGHKYTEITLAPSSSLEM